MRRVAGAVALLLVVGFVALNGEMTFTLPDDLDHGTIAVCDQRHRCARIEVTA